MTSPGGDEVGRVSIRVVPDTSGFRRELQRAVDQAEAGVEAEIPVEFDVDPNELRAKLEAIHASITVPVDFDVDTARLRAQLQALDSARIEIPVDLEVGTELARLQAQLKAIRSKTVKINVEVTGLAAAIGQLEYFSTLISLVDGRNVRVTLDVDGLGAAVTQLTAFGVALAALPNAGGGGGALSSLNSGFSSLARNITSGVMSAVQLGVQFLTAGAYATALAIAGAGITAAFGAAATAIALLPAGLALAGAPLGLLLLDFKQLGKTIKALTPQFQAFRGAVSDALAKGLAPAMEKFANSVLPKIQDSVAKITGQIGDLARQTSEWLSTTEGVNTLNTILGNVNRTITAMKPGLTDIGSAFLQLASQAAAFDVLSGAVNAFGESFRANVESLIGSGAMEQAFRGLGETLQLVGRGFADMVHNGILLFSTAAPGVNKALESITGFFNRFDWAQLGRDVSDVFTGLGEALDRIPQSTINSIQQAFDQLGATFRDVNFQQNLAHMVAGIPMAITAINNLMSTFVRFGSASVGMLTVMQGLGKAFSAFADLLANPIDAITSGRFMAAFTRAELDIAIGGKMLQDAIRGIGPGLTAAAHTLPEYVVGPLRGVPGAINTLNPQIAAAVTALGGRSANAAERAMQDTTAGAQAGLAPLPGVVQQGVAPVPAAVGTGLEPAAASAQAALEQVNTAVDTQISNLGQRVTTAMSNVKTALGNATREWAPAVTEGFTGVQTAMDTGFTNLVTAAHTGLQSITDSFKASTPVWAADVGLGMNTVVNNFTLAFTNIKTAVDTGMVSVQTSFDTGLTNINTSIVTQTGIWAANISLGFNTIANTVTLGMTLVKTAVETGMVSVTTAFTNGLTSINTTLQTQSNAWAATVSLAMNTLLNTVTLGFANITSQVQIGLQSVTDSFTTGWGNINTGLTDAMNTATETVRTGMTDMASAARDGMVEITTEFTNGGNRAVNIIDNMITRCVSSLSSAVSKFRSAGANMGQALADGLNSKADAVESAARRLADAAAAAVRAAAGIRSPSRVFTAFGEYMGEGLAIGIRSSETQVERAARSLTATVIDSVSGVQDVLAGDTWAADFNARMNTELAQHDTAGPATAAGKQVVIQTTINNPLPETGSDSVAKTNRRQAAMGLFG